MSERRETPRVEIFVQAHCAGCRELEQFLREREVQFTARDVTDDPAALEELTSRGYMTTPVTRIGEHWIAGFRRKELERLI